MLSRFAVPSEHGLVIIQSTNVCCHSSRVRARPVMEYQADNKGNVGFIFTNGDLNKTRETILAEKVAAPARAGAIAPADVFVPAGNTGMEPGKTSFFQALGVPTKIARGTIEITSDLKLVEAGGKVGASEATLLNMLNISPFTYGMGIAQVYDQGQTFPPSVLDIEEKQLLDAFASAIKTITTISLAVNYPTLPSIMHTLVNGYKKVLAVAIETDYSWPEIEELKDRIANPDAYAAAAPAGGAPAASGGSGAAEAPAAEKAPSEKEESEDEGQLSPFNLSYVIYTDIYQVLVVFSIKWLRSHQIPWKCRNDYNITLHILKLSY
jgi:large subunit ribosomal protein LP0